jgi:transcription termination factor NusB
MSNDTDPLELELSRTERTSLAMTKLVTFLEARLESHRRKNDGENLDPVQTAVLRGRIAELKQLKNLLAAGDSQD